MLIAPNLSPAKIKSEDLAAIVTAGDGRVVANVCLSFGCLAGIICSEAAAGAACVAIFGGDGKQHDREKKKLIREGVFCTVPGFLFEWVSKPWADLQSQFAADCNLPSSLLHLLQQRSVGAV